MDITLERYHGLGNDYLVYDPNKNELELNEENVKMLCNRNMGLGERRQVINEDMVFRRTLYPATCVSIGNPHCVIPMQEISEPLVCKIGRESERARYFPNHINTELMNVIDMNNIAIETYERGAGYTMANGTGACAAAGVAYKLGLTSNKVIVHMPGGELQVEIGDDWEAYMTGDVFYVAAVKLSSEFVEMLRAV